MTKEDKKRFFRRITLERAAEKSIDLLHETNGEEDENSGTEAAGSGVRNIRRLQGMIYDRVFSRREAKTGKRNKGKAERNRRGERERSNGREAKGKNCDFQRDTGFTRDKEKEWQSSDQRGNKSKKPPDIRRPLIFSKRAAEHR